MTASDGADGDQFGWAASASGSTLCVGAPYQDAIGKDSGAAYIYEFKGVGWVETQKLLGQDTVRNVVGRPHGEPKLVRRFGDMDLMGAIDVGDACPRSAGARLLSILAVGLPSALGVALHGAELLAFTLGFAAWRRLGPRG